MRRAAVVHTMLQASVQLSLCYTCTSNYSSCIILRTKLEKPKRAFYVAVVPIFWYLRTVDLRMYMLIIRTCNIGRSVDL